MEISGGRSEIGEYTLSEKEIRIINTAAASRGSLIFLFLNISESFQFLQPFLVHFVRDNIFTELPGFRKKFFMTPVIGVIALILMLMALTV